jgi:amino acid adenylation domain-containing protein
MLIGLLGILKAGGAYLPLDPAYPTARITYMLEDANVRVLLTEQKWVNKLTAEMKAPTCVCIDKDWQTITQHSTKNPVTPVTPENLMYVIYTSGSTGQPKGVQIIHRALVNFLYAIRRSVGLTPQDKLLAITTLSFDIATLELYLPLITGAQIILASRETALDALQLLDKINALKPTIMQATPATWQLLINVSWQKTPHLKILCGGEALPCSLAKQLLERGNTVWNLYGPTETTVWSSVYQVKHPEKIEERHKTVESIGRPLANTQLYILDKYLQPTPTGVPGELYIGGHGLARGYLNRPELTSEKFIPNPFDKQPDSRLYRTGDLVRYCQDGNIEYISRIDHQVKIRGFRIEIGEIESLLRKHVAVSESVVVSREYPPGNQNLIAYVVLKEAGVSNEQLLDHLREMLPEYMIPALLIILDAMPLTPNGKIDRNSLPLPEAVNTAYFNQITPIASSDLSTEQMLTAIWSHLLRREKIGLHEKFFEIGGNSLLATEVILKIRDFFSIQLPVSKLFESSTIAKLTHVIDNMIEQKKNNDLGMFDRNQNNNGTVSQEDEQLLAMLKGLAQDELDIDDVASILSGSSSKGS